MTVAVFERKAPIYMRRLMDDFGLDALGAAAIMGNAGAESGGLTKFQEINPTVKGSRGGFGWFQWTGPRRVEFEKWVARKKYDPRGDEAQYSFLFRELRGPEKKAIPAVKAAVGLEAKTIAFERAFERAGTKHYDSRIRWAKRALAAFNKAQSTGPISDLIERTKPPTLPVETIPTVPAPTAVPIKPSLWRVLWSVLRGRDSTPRVAEIPAGNPVLQVQNLLAEKGWVEVGQPDGLWGPKTRDTIKLFRLENKMPIAGDTPEKLIDAALLAALAKAEVRQIAQKRVETQARDLREQGNTQVHTLDGLGWIGKLLGIGGIAGAVNESGILTQAGETLKSVQDTAGTIAGVFASIIGVVQWCLTNWWIFAILGAIWILYKVTVGVLNVVVLFKQGILTRADK